MSSTESATNIPNKKNCKIVKKPLVEKMNDKKILEKGKAKVDTKAIELSKDTPFDLLSLGIEEHKKIIKYIVDKMYNSGTNNRSNKNGNPDSLVTSVIKNQLANKPATVGVWLKLMTASKTHDLKESFPPTLGLKDSPPPTDLKKSESNSNNRSKDLDSSRVAPENLWKLIDNSKTTPLTTEQNKRVIRKLLEFANTATCEYYCYIEKETLDTLKEYLLNADTTSKKSKTLLNNALNFRTIFLIQERAKLGSGKEKAKK